MIDTIAKDALIRLASREAFKYVVAKVPLLGWGPIGWLVSYAIEELASILLVETSIALIDIKVKGQVSDYEDALVDLKKAKTNEEKKVAKNKVIDAARDLFDFN